MPSETVANDPIATLIARFCAGDGHALEQLIDHYGGELLAFAGSKVARHESADDLAQEVWMKIWANRAKFDGNNFRAWMYKIANNHLLDQMRRKRLNNIPEGYDLAMPEWDPEDSRIDALRECLQQLDGAFVEVIRGKVSGQSTKQISLEHQISEATVATRIHRGRQLLRECVERKLQ